MTEYIDQNPQEAENCAIQAAELHVQIHSTEVAELPDSLRLIEDIKASGKEVLIAINPDTNVDSLNSVIDRIDGVHFMSVNPGFYGSPFIPEVINRIKDFKEKNPDVMIQVDGGVSIDNISGLSNAGVNRFIVGSYLLKSKDVGKSIEELKAKV